MRLLVPKEKAIKIISERISDLNSSNFNPKAWQDRTVIDLKEIFPLGSTQWLQVSQIHFDTFITSEKSKVQKEAKETARQLLISYIDFIENFSETHFQKPIIVEDNYQLKYTNLLYEWNKLVPDYNKLVEDEIKLRDENLTKELELENINQEMKRIQDNSILFDKLTFNKLIKAIFNMSIPQIILLFGVMISLISASFAIGRTFQENASNKEQYELKVERDNLKSKTMDLENEITKLKGKLTKKDSLQ
jgi:hypothetical protein